MIQGLNRRGFLRSGLYGLGLAATGLAAPHVARASTGITIVSNPGLENTTLNLLMAEQGFLERFGAEARIVEANGAAGPFDAIVAGSADVCMVSGYNLVLSRISEGAPVKIVGAGMRKAALTVFSGSRDIRGLADLEGRTVAVGPRLGLLHTLMLQLLKEKGLDASRVSFVDKGSNDQAYQAVVEGEAEACCSSVSHLNDGDGLEVIHEGDMWRALPRYVFQTAYASDAALADKYDGIVAVMAAYGALYDYLMSPGARDAFFAARRTAQKSFDAASAGSVWDFNQRERPYSRDLTVTEAEIDYLQSMLLGLGALGRRQSYSAVADMSPAQEALRLPG